MLGAILIGIGLYFGNRVYQKTKNAKATNDLSTQTELVNGTESNQESKKEIAQNLVLSLTMLGLTVGGAVYPILIPLSVVGLTYLSMRFFLRAYKELVQEHKIKSGVLDTVTSIVLLALGYFFAMALFLTFYYTSQKILLKTQDKSKQSLINILGEVPQFVWVIIKGVEVQMPFEKLQVSDIIAIHTGETIPVDGIITEGIASIDQHKLTGEAQLAEKTIGDQVFASTLLMSGKLHIRVDKAGKETVAAKIGEILNRTVDYKSSLESKGEIIVDKSAIPTLAIGAITLPILGAASAATTLLASFGYNMRIIAPISVLNHLKIASEHGVLVKDGRALELLQNVDTVVFDKTGTLTQEQPTIGSIYCYSSYTENEILCYAAAAEYKQTHPIALAILLEARHRNLVLLPIDDASYEIGYGLKVKLEDKLIRVGSTRFMAMENIVIPADISAIQAKCHEHGASLVYIAVGEKLGGVIEIRTTIRPEAKQIISKLRQRGMTIAIISGDHQEPTQQLAKELEIDHYFAETLPENKADLIKQLQKEGKSVCFVGDGINDSIALKTANVSVSLRGASTIATDTAQIILMDKSLEHLPYLFDLTYKLDDNMKNNLAISIIPGIICVGGVYFLHFGIIAATLLYNAGLAVGVTNAMLPAINNVKLQINQSQKLTPYDGRNPKSGNSNSNQ
jgi:heavy metal translocating P-type ATPase